MTKTPVPIISSEKAFYRSREMSITGERLSPEPGTNDSFAPLSSFETMDTTDHQNGKSPKTGLQSSGFDLEDLKSSGMHGILLDAMPHGVALIDERRIVRYINQSALDIMGYDSPESVIGKHCTDTLCSFSSRECPVLDLNETVENAERLLKTPQGKKKTLLKSVRALSINGRPMLLETFTDISERKKTEQKFRDTTWKYRLLVKNLPNVVFRAFKDGSVELYDNKIEAITGYSSSLFNSGKMSLRDIMLPEDMDDAQEIIRQALRKDRSYIREYRIRTHAGIIRWTQERGNIICDDHGNLDYINGVFFDITDRKKAEEELRKSKQEAEAASVIKSEFMANLSHEIRTPLNGIIGMAEVAMERVIDVDHRQILETIEKESNNLLDIVNEALDFAKIEAGKLELVHAPFDLKDLSKTIASTFSLRAEKKGLHFKLSMDRGLPNWLKGDAVRLRQILNNLLGNALKFTPKGSISLRIELLETSGSDVVLKFSVADTGIGIPENRLTSIFESYTQADGSTTRTYGGTGLGTTISKHLVEMMNGDIKVKSVVNKGSTFWFTAVFTRPHSSEIPEATDNLDISGLNVLVVDDDENIRDIVMVFLDILGCTSQASKDGTDALACLQQAAADKNPFDLVLTDVTMPGMDGFKLAEAIMAQPELGHPPVVLITGLRLSSEEKEKARPAISGYIQKPIKLDVLKQALSSLAGRRTEKTEHPEGASGGSGPPGRNIRVLLVEDYPTNQQVALYHLKRAGFHARLAENGQEALDTLKEEPFDLVFMDMQMPVMDGYDAIKKIRLDESESRLIDKNSRRMIIIAMTAHAMKGDREKCLDSGADDYLAKPLKRRELLIMINKWLPNLKTAESSADGSGVKPSPVTQMLPMDMDRAMEEFCNDRTFLFEVIESFMKRLASQVTTLWQAIEKKDFSVLAQEAHAIKGGAANLTAMSLSLTAGRLESLARENRIEPMTEVMHALEKEYQRLAGYLKTQD